MQKSVFNVAVLSATLLLFAASSLAAGSRGLNVPLRESEAKDAAVLEEVELYGASHALVIGIDNYSNGWPRRF